LWLAVKPLLTQQWHNNAIDCGSAGQQCHRGQAYLGAFNEPGAAAEFTVLNTTGTTRMVTLTMESLL